jgi:hypothetical protein
MQLGFFCRAFALAAAIAIAACPFAAQAITLSESGTTARLSGPIETGDDALFQAFLAKPRPKPLKTLVLASPGGSITPGMVIGLLVRTAKLATVVDADNSACSSACTFVFAGGVQRHYVNGDNVFEGSASFYGLGFHPARQQPAFNQPSTYSAEGVQRMRQYYARMGMPGASDLMERAAINTMFRPNGQTALRLKIATTLQPPRE